MNLSAPSSKALVVVAAVVAASALASLGCSGTGGPPEVVGYGDGGARSALASGEVADGEGAADGGAATQDH